LTEVKKLALAMTIATLPADVGLQYLNDLIDDIKTLPPDDAADLLVALSHTLLERSNND
jgi:hypothetical protein